jgi:L-malate glycosyltransferase
MKVLVYAHRLAYSGTTVNAVELAASLRDMHGHDVILFATPGPMLDLVRERGLRYEPAPAAHMHPSPARMRALRQLMRRERPDVIHAWDWFQCVDAFYAGHLMMRTPMLVTDMSMTLQRMLPKGVPTTFGTPDLVEQARASGRQRASLMLPPVDVNLNAPGVVEHRLLRDRFAIADDEFLVVTVSRLDGYMKGDSLTRTIDCIGTGGRRRRARSARASRERRQRAAGPGSRGLHRRIDRSEGGLRRSRRLRRHGQFGPAGDGLRSTRGRGR